MMTQVAGIVVQAGGDTGHPWQPLEEVVNTVTFSMTVYCEILARLYGHRIPKDPASSLPVHELLVNANRTLLSNRSGPVVTAVSYEQIGRLPSWAITRQCSQFCGRVFYRARRNKSSSVRPGEALWLLWINLPHSQQLGKHMCNSRNWTFVCSEMDISFLVPRPWPNSGLCVHADIHLGFRNCPCSLQQMASCHSQPRNVVSSCSTIRRVTVEVAVSYRDQLAGYGFDKRT